MTSLAIVVHGGAGRVEAERHPAIVAACARAAARGHQVLVAGGRALDAAQAAVRVLEDEPELNAALGAVLGEDGQVELDAALVDGEALAIGAIAAVPDVRQPIDLARAVLDDGRHVLLAGPGAWDFARARGFTPAPPGALVTERARARWLAARARAASPLREGGTVGAVALDRRGHLAAATSTGGIAGKRRGRVGDSPLPGAGTWADDRGGAASATGDGEAIIRVALTRRLVDRLAAGELPQAAAQDLVAELAARGRGHGGVIVVDRAGRVAAVHDTDTMATAAIVDDAGGRRQVATMSTAGTDLASLLAPPPA